MTKSVAVVLSGCGYLDGAEIHEATLALLALDLGGARVQCFAPDKEQMHVMNHVAKAPATGESRNVLVESGRIARSNIKPLAQANVSDFDALVFPGGYGAAKNLSDYAIKGPECTVDPQVDALIKAAHAAKKPICAVCIAPVLIAKSLGAEHHPTLTIGSDPGTAAHIEQMGAKHVEAPVTGIAIDKANAIVSTPAYMCDASIGQVWVGIKQAIDAILTMV